MGSILITQNGVETAGIRSNMRDKALRDFFEMVEWSLRYGDKTYMTDSTFSHKFSYGEYYPAFVHLSWEDFRKVPTLSGISWGTYNFIVNAFLPLPDCIVDESEFHRKNEPRGEGGFEQPATPYDYLCNIERWRVWHRNYLTDNPEKIVWGNNTPFLNNVESIYSILDFEIGQYVHREYKDRIDEAINSDREANLIREELFKEQGLHEHNDSKKPLKKNAIAIFFHRKVMPSFAPHEKEAYCVYVGDRICLENYYVKEPILSSSEQQANGSLRHIYSIRKNGLKQYISFDFEKGMFEFHDNRGVHLGEYLFDGTLNSAPQADHNFKTKV